MEYQYIVVIVIMVEHDQNISIIITDHLLIDVLVVNIFDNIDQWIQMVEYLDDLAVFTTYCYEDDIIGT